jgi:hypothetical protein
LVRGLAAMLLIGRDASDHGPDGIMPARQRSNQPQAFARPVAGNEPMVHAVMDD